MTSRDNMLKIWRKMRYNNARAFATVCRNILINIVIYPVGNYFYELQFILQSMHKNFLSNGTNFVFDSVKTKKLFTILLKRVAKWRTDCPFLL